ncbi:MAG TPA: HAD family hydrolase [Methylomirabilota bacterium]|nr:HAD family hydrolase [Methylomirabilota bacterium]
MADERPDILALDFDGVLCEGTREYFETSRRTHARVWPERTPAAEALLPAFRDLRPVIETGWEMPVLLDALVRGLPRKAIGEAWGETRDELLAHDPRGRDRVVAALKTTLDQVRREWIAADLTDWLSRHALYCDREAVRRVVEGPARTVIVTTKEGEFARQILEHWGLPVAGIQGKEAGSHKCENLRVLRSAYRAETGRAATLWFVEDRLETLECVRGHADLDDVRLFLATWGYNTARAREAARRGRGIDPLTLAEFSGPFSGWGQGG